MDQLINSPSSSFLRLQLREAPSHVRLPEPWIKGTVKVPSHVLRLDLCARSALMISERCTSRRSRSSPLRLPNHEGAMPCEIGAGGCKSWIGLSMLRRNVGSFVSGAKDGGILAKQEDDGKEVKHNCDEIELFPDVVHKKDNDIHISIKIRLKHPISPKEMDQLGSDVLKHMKKNECKSKEEKPAVVSTAFKIAGSMAFVAAVSFITIWKTSPELVKFLTNFFVLQKTAEPLRTIMYSQLQKFNPFKKLISKWEKIDLGEKTDGVWRLIQLKIADKPLVKDEEQKDAKWEKIYLGEKTDGVWRLIQLKTTDKPLVKDEEQRDAEEGEPYEKSED